MVLLGITDFFPHTNADMGKALGRVRFVQGFIKFKRIKRY